MVGFEEPRWTLFNTRRPPGARPLGSLVRNRRRAKALIPSAAIRAWRINARGSIPKVSFRPRDGRWNKRHRRSPNPGPPLSALTDQIGIGSSSWANRLSSPLTLSFRNSSNHCRAVDTYPYVILERFHNPTADARSPPHRKSRQRVTERHRSARAAPYQRTLFGSEGPSRSRPQPHRCRRPCHRPSST